MKKNRGFTLIEMLVVIAVISILAGMVLVGVRNFQVGARDTARVASMRNIQNILELYYTKCGQYPGGSACRGSVINNDYGSMVKVLEDAKVVKEDKLAKTGEPGAVKWVFRSCDTKQSYTLGVRLEQGNQAAVDDDAAACPLTGITCVDTDTFCVSSQ